MKIFLKIYALKRERDQEKPSLKERSSLQPLRQGRSLTAQLQQSRESKVSLHICRNMFGHVLIGRPSARLETMVLARSSYVVVCILDKRR